MHTYVVSIRAERPLGNQVWNLEQVQIPNRCPCCAGDISPDSFIDVENQSTGSVTYHLRFPCCARCATHIELAKHPPAGGVGGCLVLTGISLFIVGGIILASENASLLITITAFLSGIILCGFGIWRTLLQRKEPLNRGMTQNCSSDSEPIRYLGVWASSLAQGVNSIVEPISAVNTKPTFIVGPDGVAVTSDTLRSGNVHVFEFKNRIFAELFAKANGVQVRESTQEQ